MKSFSSAPKVIVLVGIPGSGKSTWAQKLCQLHGDSVGTWAIISQDKLKKRDACVAAIRKASKDHMTKIIVDRCNVQRDDRIAWIKGVMGKGAWCVVFNTDLEECVMRVSQRKDHPSLPPEKSYVARFFQETFEAPSKDEGFDRIVYINDDSDANALLFELTGVEYEGESSESPHKKFPRTRHIVDMGGTGVTRDDLVMSADERSKFLDSGIVVAIEEKVDGANLGISLGENWEFRVQNRSHFVTSESALQFKRLDWWIDQHSADLVCILSDNGDPTAHTLYGEWCYAQHSVPYDRLPDYFLAFDVMDNRTGSFMSLENRNALLNDRLAVVPHIATRAINGMDDVAALLEIPSALRSEGPLEGIYLRIDQGDSLEDRGKVVRPDFIHGIDTHWASKELVKNRVVYC